MICQNCLTDVDNDLIFCTNCGERLTDAKSEAQTVLINPIVTKATVDSQTPKPASNLKWMALIVALIAIPASIFGIYLLTKTDDNQQVAQNVNKPKTPAPTATRKANTNQNTNANGSNTNANQTNSNASSNTNSSKPKDKNVIMNERIEIAPKSHHAVPFTVEADTAEIIGKVKVLQGGDFEGFVFLKGNYDNHFPDTNYKVFSFGGEKSDDVDQTLVDQEYVLVIVNKNDKPITIQGIFSLK